VFIDHGMGVVIWRNSDNRHRCPLYQGVTLGAPARCTASVTPPGGERGGGPPRHVLGASPLDPNTPHRAGRWLLQ